MKKFFSHLFNRVIIVGFLLLVQIAALMLIQYVFSYYSVFFNCFCIVLAGITILHIINNNINPAAKIAWIIPLCFFPIFGAMFYAILGKYKLSKHQRKRMISIYSQIIAAQQYDVEAAKKLESIDIEAHIQSNYITRMAYSSPFDYTETRYFSEGKDMYECMLEKLQQAEHFIFMEYFIVENGIMWDTILDILIEKAAQGVDVRFMYDDMGCIFTLPPRYYKFLENNGIKACAFNKFIPVLSSRHNNRDHRKICVIDGYVGFTGGINLADEYINAINRYGHWKDGGILLQGEAVWSLTVMFLSMWNYIYGTEDDFNNFRPDIYAPRVFNNDGFVQPYTDTPFDDEAIGENVYLNLINRANHYVYIMTPYLVIDNEITVALTNAAKCGLDVRLVLPAESDNKIVQSIGKTYYENLLAAGVKIYEYTPGFVHTKAFVADDKYSIIGTINLDYRSLYLHFECGAWLYGCSTVLDVKKDFLETFEQCHLVTLEECHKTNPLVRLWRAVLKVLAPLL